MKKNSIRSNATILAYEKGYFFDIEGNVISPSKNKLKIMILKNLPHYPFFNVAMGKRRVNVLVHCLKAYILFGDKVFQNNIEIRHKNNNPMDWSDSNIILGTHKDNMLDIPLEKRNRISKNAAKVLRKFSNDEVREIRKLREQGYTLKEISEIFSVVKSTIFYIVKNRTYSELVA